VLILFIVGAIAGVGGGGILTSVMIVISDVVSLQKRGTYNGILGVVVALANSVGPLVGGIFTEKASWRWCFVGFSKISCMTRKLISKIVYQHSTYIHCNGRSRFRSSS
jgi:MFS family permease